MSNNLSSHRYLTFSGPIHPSATQGLRAALCVMVNEGAKKITILFASGGGSTEDGMALYTYLKALPVKLEMHATGFVSSMAIPVFLAAPSRRASINARFFFHEFSWTYGQPTELTQTSMKDHSVQLETARSWAVQITQENMNLPQQDFERLRLFEEPLLIDPGRAAEIGLISEVTEPTMPAESQPRIVM